MNNSKTLTVTFEVNEQLLQNIRSSNSLAEDLNDNEIVEHLEEFVAELKDDLGLVLENLEYFNQ